MKKESFIRRSRSRHEKTSKEHLVFLKSGGKLLVFHHAVGQRIKCMTSYTLA